MKMFFDGKIVFSKTIVMNSFANLDKLILGMNGDLTQSITFPCNCHINDVAVYTRTLSHEEVAKSYTR